MAELVTKVEGLSEVLKALDELPVVIERKVVREGLRKSMRPMLATMLSLVPVGKPFSTWNGNKRTRAGKLKRSVRIRTRNKAGLPEVTVSAGNKEAWYAHIVERGAAPHPIRRKGKRTNTFGGSIKHPGFPGRFFTRRTFERHEMSSVGIFKEHVKVRIPKEWALLEKKAKKLPV